MATIIESVFSDTTVRLDGNAYVRCKFAKCTLVFGAAAPVALEGCEFGDCSWQFDGAAALTLEFLAAMYRGMGDGGKALVESTLSNIREGKTHKG